jgi:hypothetical protein
VREGRWSGLGVVLSAVILAGCSRMPTTGSDGTRDPTPLPENKVEHSAASDLFVGRVWRVTEAPSQPAFGSAYIFLANGTLVEMSCGEPYRIALWTREPGQRTRTARDGGQAAGICWDDPRPE